MHFAAWDARLSTPDESGTPARAHLVFAAARGSEHAILTLEGPTFPAALEYLWEWFQELRRGLGEGLNGIAPLSWVTLDAWARRTDRDPEPHEADALFSLDAVTRHPELMEAA